jgi:ribosomal protein S4E
MANEVNNGDRCLVSAGTHTGKSGIVEDKKSSKSGAVTITVRQDDGVRLKTLAKNVEKIG